MGMQKLQDGKVRVYVDVDPAPALADAQAEVAQATAAISANDPLRQQKIDLAAAQARNRYLDRLLATAHGQFQEERAVHESRAGQRNLDREISAKQAELARLNAQKTATVAGSAEIAGDVSGDAGGR